MEFAMLSQQFYTHTVHRKPSGESDSNVAYCQYTKNGSDTCNLEENCIHFTGSEIKFKIDSELFFDTSFALFPSYPQLYGLELTIVNTKFRPYIRNIMLFNDSLKI